jgi:redox-sensitive bicupin YhaK (pirin superfamily)
MSADAPSVELVPAGSAEVAGTAVRRALPTARRRTVGAWCFADHFGPAGVGPDHRAAIGPHPHIGLQTVTWLVAGEQRHRDSLGSDQVIRAGQLNLMTAGHGVVHAEESLDYQGTLHGVQLWVALPDAVRHSDPDFEHLPELPRVAVGAAEASVLVGALDGARSPARVHSPLLGVDLRVRAGDATVPLDRGFEHGVVVLEGDLDVGGTRVRPGTLAFLAAGRDELPLRADGDARALLLGGAPFEEPLFMWWNFVGRTRRGMEEARRQWVSGDGRFGPVESTLDRMPAPGLPWRAEG